MWVFEDLRIADSFWDSVFEEVEDGIEATLAHAHGCFEGVKRIVGC